LYVWGADWAAVVSPSPRDEASAKHVLPWPDRHGPLKRSARFYRQPWAPLCVSGWSHGCAVQPLQRPVPVASALQTSHTLHVNDANHLPTIYAFSRETPHHATCRSSHTGGSTVTYQSDSPSHICNGSLDEAARMLDRALRSAGRAQSFDYLAYGYTCLSSSPTRVYTHRLDFGPRVAHCPQATHICIVRAPVPPPHTHVPAPPHTLTQFPHPLSLA
jgi:hypothetical protein